MRNVSDKSCREYQKTRFMFSDIFLKVFPFMIQCGEILHSRTGHRCQYGACALYAGYLRLKSQSQNF